MAATFTNYFGLRGIVPLFPGEEKWINVAIGASLTLTKGTVLGEINASDVWTVTLGSQSSGTFFLTFGGQTINVGNSSDVWLITLGTQSSGTFTLSWGGSTTGALAYGATGATVQTAFAGLSSVGGNATVTGSGGGPYTLTFTGPLAGIANSAVTADFSALTTPGNASIGHTTTGGSPTGAAYTATGANLQTYLTALSSVGAGNMTVSGGAGGPYTVTAAGTLANKPNGALTGNFAGLTTPSNASIVHATTGVLLGTFKAYASGNTDGSQTAKGILQFDVVTDSLGNITLGQQAGGGPWFNETFKTVPLFVEGTFLCSDLTGLDSTAVTALGRLIEGTVTNGQFRMP